MAEPTTSKEAGPLSEREVEILRLVATGATNQQIATQLDITLNTVKVHLRNIFAKIGVASRTEASLYAVRNGLVIIDTPRALTPPPEVAVALSTTADSASDGAESATVAETPVPPIVVAEPSVVAGGTPALRRPIMWVAGAALAAAVLVGTILWVIRTLPLPSAPSPNATATPAAPSNLWRTRTPMGVPRVRFGATSYNDKIYVIGGMEASSISGAVERYTPQSDTWTQLSSKLTPAADIQVIAIGGKLYAAGGQLASGAISDRFEVYDPDRDEWKALPNLPAPRSQYAALAIDGKFYLFGGWDGTAYRAEVWMFDPDSNSWKPRAPMPSPHGNMGADVVGNRVHLIGGRDANGSSALHRSYDPFQDREGGQPWRVLPRAPHPVEAPASTTVLNSIYTFDPNAGELLIYDVGTEAWRSFSVQLPAGTTDIRAVLVNTGIHLLGDSSTPGSTAFHLQYEVIYRTFLPLGPAP